MKHYTKIFSLLMLLSNIFCSCIGNNNSQQKPINSKELGDSDIYFSIQNEKIHFINDNIDKIISILGKPTTDEIIGGDEEGRFSCAIFNGLRVDYYNESGKLRKIQIDKKSYSIISGVTIGDKKNLVENLLLYGRYITDNNSYLFYKEYLNTDMGIGYEIYYDKNDKISNIIITTMSFAP